MNKDLEAIEQQACEWSVKLSGDDVNAQMLEEFMAWKAADPEHAQAFARAEQVWHSLGQLDSLRAHARLPQKRGLDTARLWQAIKLYLQPNPQRMGFAVLMICVLLSGFWLLTQRTVTQAPAQYQVVTTAQNQTQNLVLEDGSQVTLGAASELRLAFEPDLRRVELLRGEALFVVAHNPKRPFEVKAGGTRTRVLGTIFNVKRFDQVVTVAVKQGRVAVGSAAAAVELSQGQAVEADLRGQTADVQTIDSALVGSWSRNRLSYHNATLKELVADINRYSARRIILADPSLANLRVTLSADTANIESMLDDLAQMLPISLNRERAESIIISPR